MYGSLVDSSLYRWTAIGLKTCVHVYETRSFIGLYNEVQLLVEIFQTAALLEVGIVGNICYFCR